MCVYLYCFLSLVLFVFALRQFFLQSIFSNITPITNRPDCLGANRFQMSFHSRRSIASLHYNLSFFRHPFVDSLVHCCYSVDHNHRRWPLSLAWPRSSPPKVYFVSRIFCNLNRHFPFFYLGICFYAKPKLSSSSKTPGHSSTLNLHITYRFFNF